VEVDRAFAIDFDRRWSAAWNAHDPDAVVALLAPDVEWFESGVRRVLRGHGETRRRVETDFRTMPDLRGETLQLFVDEETAAVAIHWRLTGTYDRTRPVSFDGVSLWRFAGPLLVRVQMIYDVADAAAQAGVPAPGAARATGAAPRGIQRLTARAREARRGR
jgi:ketosteroid isomerase-like protein